MDDSLSFSEWLLAEMGKLDLFQSLLARMAGVI
jgi:hypothetical protein